MTTNEKESVLVAVHEILKPRITCFTDIWPWIDYFFAMPDYNVSLLTKTLPKGQVLEYFNKLISYIESNGLDNVEQFIRKDLDPGKKLRLLLPPIRVAVTGKVVSLPLFESISILGKEVVLERLKLAKELLDV